MKYQKIIPAVFIARPNRFVAHVYIGDRQETVHVKNTGRCRELLTEGCTVYLSVADNPSRKTRYDLVAVEKKRQGKAPFLINMDSQIANDVAAEWLSCGNLFSSSATIRREVTHGRSRFDFYVEDGSRKAFVEVKGVTLEKDGVAMFPDAPTERGVKHVKELAALIDKGFEAYILFIVQMKDIRLMRPYDSMHQAFGDALREAAQSGVSVLAVDCLVTRDGIVADQRIPVLLEAGSGKEKN